MYYENTYEDYIQDAIEIVSGWDISEESFTLAVRDQAMLMTSLDFHYFDMDTADTQSNFHRQ
jgi:hypothetical protein